MKKRDTNRFFWIKKILKIDDTYYRSNPKYSRSNEVSMHLALVVDGIVEDIIHCEDRLGYLLLSDPTVVDLGKNYLKVNVSDIYDEETNSFSKEIKSV